MLDGIRDTGGGILRGKHSGGAGHRAEARGIAQERADLAREGLDADVALIDDNGGAIPLEIDARFLGGNPI